MSSALTLQYRPKKWSDVVEQTATVETLSRMVQSGRIHPAIVLYGPAGTGKTTVARILTSALNCEAAMPDLLGVSATAEAATVGKPCGTCATCRSLLDGTSIALVEMDAASNGLIDDVRRIQEEVQIVGTERYRVYVLDEAHGLSAKAWDALLKLLEEPPPGVVFVFCTTEIEKVPETILSRTFAFGLKRVSQEAVLARLEHIAGQEFIPIDKPVLEAICYRVDGGLRDGISLLEQLSVLAAGTPITMELFDRTVGQVGFAKLVEFMTALIGGDVEAVYRLLDEIATTLSDLSVLVGQLVEAAQWICRLKIGSTLGSWSRARMEQISRLPAMELHQAVDLQRRLLGLYEQARRSKLPVRVVVETGLIALMDLRGASVLAAPPVVGQSASTMAPLAVKSAHVAEIAQPRPILGEFRTAADIAAAIGGIIVQTA